MLLDIKNLCVEIDNKRILNGLNLQIKPGEIHAIMGPNGSGKSTLAKVLAGDPRFDIVSGEILFEEQNLLEMDVEDRAKKGLFLAFQYPVEIAGVNNKSFLRMAYNSKLKAEGKEEVDPVSFHEILMKNAATLGMPEDHLDRQLNFGFSGGEKKRNEMLQMLMLEPKMAILDETDSGLDIDALRIIANAVNESRKKHNAFLIITHYQRLLDYIKPDIVHVLGKGMIQKSGDASLALALEEKGYDQFVK